MAKIRTGVGKMQQLAKPEASARIKPNGGTIIKPKSLSSTNRYLRGPNALVLHARNVATSTAVETSKPFETYIERCLLGHEAGGPVFDPARHKLRIKSGEAGPKPKRPSKKC